MVLYGSILSSPCWTQVLAVPEVLMGVVADRWRQLLVGSFPCQMMARGWRRVRSVARGTRRRYASRAIQHAQQKPKEKPMQYHYYRYSHISIIEDLAAFLSPWQKSRR